MHMQAASVEVLLPKDRDPRMAANLSLDAHRQVRCAVWRPCMQADRALSPCACPLALPVMARSSMREAHVLLRSHHVPLCSVDGSSCLPWAG